MWVKGPMVVPARDRLTVPRERTDNGGWVVGASRQEQTGDCYTDGNFWSPPHVPSPLGGSVL